MALKSSPVKITFLCTVIFISVTTTCSAQSTPFMTDEEIIMLTNEISGDRSFEHIRRLTPWHRPSGSEGYFKAAEYILRAAREAGLEDVKFIEHPVRGPSFNIKKAELWMTEPVRVKLADTGDHATYLATGSRDADATAELVWIGDASENALRDVDVKGKIVLTNGSPERAVRNAVWSRGALGVIACGFHGSKSIFDHPDQVSWMRIPMDLPEGRQPTFAFSISARKADMLRRAVVGEISTGFFGADLEAEKQRIVVRAIVDTEISELPAKSGFVEGWIRGSKYHDQQIVLTSHIQEEQGSANDDASGCGNMLELARTFNKLIEEGKMPRPLRDIRFWWADEIDSEYWYLTEYPDESKKMLANINQDMVGARQSMGSRVQHLIYAPHSRTSYLDTLLESIGTYVIQTNNQYLAVRNDRNIFSNKARPIFSTRGSREGYNAQFVPYFDASDHRCFVEGIIGVPAVALINFSDGFIHSSDDDLYQVDHTQLARNSFIVGALTHILAFMESEDVPLLASQTYAHCLRRLGADFAAATRLPADGSEGWKEAVNIIEMGVERELRALNSIHEFAKDDAKGNEMIDAYIESLGKAKTKILKDLEVAYRSSVGADPPEVELSPAEVAANSKVPANIASLKDYFSKRWQMRYHGDMQRLMCDEVMNFVDGKRSYYEIYRAVRAESLSVGAWYYGSVTLEDVTAYLDAAVETGALVLTNK